MELFQSCLVCVSAADDVELSTFQTSTGRQGGARDSGRNPTQLDQTDLHVLGRSDELFEQNRDCGKDDEASVVCEQLIVSGCDAAELFEFVEEPLDEISFLIERFVIVDWGSAV